MTVPPALRSARGPSGPTREVMRQAFKWANQRVMLPILHNHVVGPWVGSPVIGYFATLTTIGRCSGLPRQTPLNYAILDGRIYLLSGFGVHADWYRNLIVNPRVTLALPGRTLSGTAAPVLDPVEAERAALAVARNFGLALVLEGLNPLTATDERLRVQLAGRPVVRTTSRDPVRPGRHDPGSQPWVLPHVVAPLALIAAVRFLTRGCAR